MTTERGDMYWASMLDTQDVVREFTSRRKAYLAHLRGTSALRRSFRALNAYYGFGPAGQADTTELTNSGETGEFTEMSNLGIIFQIFRELCNQIANRASRVGHFRHHVTGVPCTTRIENFFLTFENLIEIFR